MTTRARAFQARRVFLDSSGFLALTNSRDRYHQEARSIWTRLTDERWRTFTTNFVVAETHALFIIRLGHQSATDFLREIRQSATVVVRVTATDEQQAERIIFQYSDKTFSYTDAATFAVMDRLGIPYAFTFDHDFAQYGLNVLSAT